MKCICYIILCFYVYFIDTRSLFDLNDVVDYEILNNISFFDNLKYSLSNEYCSTQSCIVEGKKYPYFFLI